jgi:hypothetical protein
LKSLSENIRGIPNESLNPYKSTCTKYRGYEGIIHDQEKLSMTSSLVE